MVVANMRDVPVVSALQPRVGSFAFSNPAFHAQLYGQTVRVSTMSGITRHEGGTKTHSNI